MKIVYCANRKIYPQLPTAINSLLQNNPNVEKIYLLIEDDSIPYITNEKIQFINCSNLDLIRTGINCTKRFTYMALTRCFLSSILNEDKVLYLDVDTLVDGNLDELWNFDMGGACICGYFEGKEYLNSGVLLMDLDLIRQLDTENTTRLLLEKCRFMYPDQDVLNIVYKLYKKTIPKKFNVLGKIEPYKNEVVIRHFAGLTKPWQNGEKLQEDIDLYNKYKVNSI